MLSSLLLQLLLPEDMNFFFFLVDDLEEDIILLTAFEAGLVPSEPAGHLLLSGEHSPAARWAD